MKKIHIVAMLMAVLLGAVLSKRLSKRSQEYAYAIALVQTASHPALDAVQQGFLDGLRQYMPGQVAVRTYNAQGSIAQAHTIAQQLHTDGGIQAIFAIATPAVQAVSAVEKDKPIIIAAVTDPNALGIVHPLTNVTGTTDMIDSSAAVDLMQALLPQVQKVGLLFTAGETNAVVAAAQMRTALEARSIQVIDYIVAGELDMPAVVDRACRAVEALMAPTDNTVAASIQLIAEIAQRHAKPLFVSDVMLVQAGALAARGVDYYAAGKQSAALAQQVLVQGKKPYALPIEQPSCDTIVINKRVLEQLGIAIPTELATQVTLVG